MMKRIICVVMMLVLMVVALAGCSSGSSYGSKGPGTCGWCDGWGYSTYKDANGNYKTKDCPHC